MRQCLFGLFCCIFLSLVTFSSQAEDTDNVTPPTLILGVLPTQSPVTQFKQLAPLRDYLAQQLKVPVELKTTINYSRHLSEIGQRQYDILLTAPHMALLASDQGQYLPVATFTKTLAAVVVVREDNPIQDLNALARATIATPSEKAIVTMVGKNYLMEQGLQGQDQPRYEAFRTHNAAYKAVLGRQASAAIIANFIYGKAKSQGAKLRLIGESPHFPGIGILVAKDLSLDMREAVRNTFVTMKETKQGRAVIKHLTFPPYMEAKAEQFESLRPYLSVLTSAQ